VLVPGRDRYLDVLRAIALVRIVAFHTFYQAVWLTVVFPSLGVMFALAGALMARSLERPPGRVLAGRMRRLLPPLWVYSAVVVGLLVLQGWRPETGDAGGWWLRLLLWFVPVGVAPYPEVDPSLGEGAPLAWGLYAADILWYIRAYFWFVVLSPLLLKAFDRMPWVTLAAPLVLTAVLTADLVPMSDSVGYVVFNFATYGSCWVLGFAYQRGLLHAVPLRAAFLGALALMGLGLWWAATHLPEVGWDLGAIPMAQALWSFGFVVLLLRISPSWSVLPRRLRPFDRFVTLVNNRAITIYLWHIPLLAAVVPLIDLLWGIPLLEESVPWLLESQWLQFAGVMALLAGVLVVVGWVEDVAAGRPIRWWPTGGGNARDAQRRHDKLPPMPAAASGNDSDAPR
jgi:peptidoglycan/LPS O-acetylase OafA/YrhL